jgi:hypothetical protein
MGTKNDISLDIKEKRYGKWCENESQELLVIRNYASIQWIALIH